MINHLQNRMRETVEKKEEEKIDEGVERRDENIVNVPLYNEK